MQKMLTMIQCTDDQIDEAIYKIDGVMNDYDPANPALNVPPFTHDSLVRMRAVIRGLSAG